jgi:NADH-quinone oxidoreductase subunit E
MSHFESAHDLRMQNHPLFKQPFAFTQENQKIAENTLKNYPPHRQGSAILPLLDLAQRQCGGWLPPPAIESVAAYLNISLIRAYEVVSFYTMFNLRPVGKHHIQVCRTISCWLRGAEQILSACAFHLKIKPGETTADDKFTLTEVECLGACVNAPVVQINDDYHEDLTPDTIKGILQKLALNKAVENKKPKYKMPINTPSNVGKNEPDPKAPGENNPSSPDGIR